jgi:rSAM/selenodomain-associated transferase 2
VGTAEHTVARLDVSVIIPTLNAAGQLAQTLAACRGIAETIVVDGGSTDQTVAIASALGARVVASDRGRGIQLHRGATEARGPWLLFLHADTVLTGSWWQDIQDFAGHAANRLRVAAFRFGLDDPSASARRLERIVAWRVRHLGLPYGDQGLLIHRELYQLLGGYRPWPLMEDVDLVRRAGRRRLTVLPSVARTSAVRFRRQGWRRRSGRNFGCLALYFLGVSPRVIARLYGE